MLTLILASFGAAMILGVAIAALFYALAHMVWK